MKIMLTVIVLSISVPGHALSLATDSVQTDSSKAERKSKNIRRFSTRLHSAGFFNFSGRICSPNPAIDMGFAYETRGWGASIFSAKDLYEKGSENNFTFGLIYKRIKVSDQLSLTPNVGVVMDGFGKSFGDRVLLISSFKISKRLTVDETMIFANLISDDTNEWINRVRFVYSQSEHVQFTLSNWNNSSVFDGAGYISGAFQAAYNRIKLDDHAYLQTAIAFFVMAKNSETVPEQEKNGFVFTLTLSID